MKLLPPLICTTLLYYLAITPSQALEPANFIRLIESSLSNPMTVRIDSHLITVSKTKKHLIVNSTNPEQNPCRFSVNPFDEYIQGRIHAASIETTKKILVWGVQSIENIGSSRRTYYTLLFVDPFNCTYKPIRLPEDDVPISWPRLSPTITFYDITNEPKFEVYFPTQLNCNPCRYDANKGNGIQQHPYYYTNRHSNHLSTEDANAVPLNEFWMQSYRSKDDWNYYLFYVYNFRNGSAILKLINGDKQAEKKIRVDHTIDAVSISYGNYQNTAVCYVIPRNPGHNDHQSVVCERLNERLRPGLIWELPTPSRVQLVSDISLEVDAFGNTFIGVMYNWQIRLYVYNVDGDLVGELNFGVVNQDMEYRELHGIRVGDEYCLVTVEQENYQAVKARHVIKCVDVSRYLDDNFFLADIR